MKLRSLLAGAGLLALLSSMSVLVACASDDPSSPDDVTPDSGAPPEASADALPEDAAAPCADCMYFPPECTPDAVCTNDAADPRLRIHSIRGRTANDVWASGAEGMLLHFDGTAWTRSPSGTLETMRNLWLRESSEVAFVSLKSIYTRGFAPPDGGAPSAGGWSAQGAPAGPDAYRSSYQLEAVWAAPGAEWLWCGTMQENAIFLPGFGSGLWRLHVRPDTNALEVADAFPLGTCEKLPCNYMTALHGISGDDLWAVGFKGAAFHITGAQGPSPALKPFDTRTLNTIYGVWAASESEAWLVGGAGVIRHYTGDATRWEIVDDVPTTETLHAISGSSPTDIWAVGDRGVVLHYDGKGWSRVKVSGVGGRRPNLYSLWIPSPGHVWIGGEGVLLSIGGKP